MPSGLTSFKRLSGVGTCGKEEHDRWNVKADTTQPDNHAVCETQTLKNLQFLKAVQQTFQIFMDIKRFYILRIKIKKPIYNTGNMIVIIWGGCFVFILFHCMITRTN